MKSAADGSGRVWTTWRAGSAQIVALRDRLVAARARIVLTARVMAVLPVILLRAGALVVARRDRAHVRTPLGQAVVRRVGRWQLSIGYVWMQWLAQLPDEERVLVRR